MVLLDPHWVIRQLKSVSDPFDGDQDPYWGPQKRVLCSKQATWCSAEETGRNIQRCLCACKNLLGLPITVLNARDRSACCCVSWRTTGHQSRLNHELILVAHSARPVDLDGVTEDFVRFNDQRKDDFGLQSSWQQCQTLDSYSVSVALLQCDTVNVMNLMVVTWYTYVTHDSVLMLPFSCSHRPGVCMNRPNCLRQDMR